MAIECIEDVISLLSLDIMPTEQCTEAVKFLEAERERGMADPPDIKGVCIGEPVDGYPQGPEVDIVWFEQPGDPSVGIPGWSGYVVDWGTVRFQDRLSPLQRLEDLLGEILTDDGRHLLNHSGFGGLIEKAEGHAKELRGTS